MQANHPLVSLVLLGLALVAGCSGSGSSMALPPQGSMVSLTMIDAPPPGTSVISFEVNVTGATLQPGNIDLLAGSGPVQIEVKHLEVETAFISTASVPAGSGPFTSLNLTFANPELTFQNNSNPPATIANCAPGLVCQIKLTGTLTTSVGFSPALSISSGSNIGLKVDVKLDQVLTTPTATSIGVDFSQMGGVTVAQSQLKPQGELEDVDDIFGTVQNRNTGATPNTFDLVTSLGTSMKGIQVSGNAQIEAKNCSPLTFANCIQNGDMVEVDLLLMPGGALVATKIEKENDAANEQELEGVVFSVNVANNTFQMVAVENASSLPSSSLGTSVTVSVPIGTNFDVDTDGLNLSSSQQVLANAFTSGGIAQLQPGQNVQVKLATGPSGTIIGDGSAANPFVANRVRLRMSRFSGTVATQPANGIFNVTPASNTVLAAAGVTTIQVQTSSQTQFEGVSDVTGLAVNDMVALRGLLFKGPPVTLVAGKVRKR